MATKTTSGTGAQNLDVGDVSQSDIATLVAQLTGTGFTGSLTVQGRVIGSSAAFVPIPYKRRNLGGTVSDDTSVSAALTADALIIIDASGLEIRFAFSALSAGSMKIDYALLDA